MPDDALSAWLQEGTSRSEHANGTPSALWDDPDRERSWLEGSSDGEPRKRTWRLMTLAVVPWLAVAAMVAAGWRPSQRVPPAAPPTESTISQHARMAHQPHSAQRPMALASRAEPGSTNALDPALGAIAAAAVQQAFTGTDQASGRSRYINLALPDAVTWVGDVAVIGVTAVVLEGAEGRWDQPQAARYAVPLQVRADAIHVLSVPWALPDPPQTAPAGTAFAPVNDQALTEAAGRALNAAGYRDVHVQAIARDEGLPGVLKVEVTGINPVERQPRSQEVWVSDQPSPTVLGAPHPGIRLDAGAQPTEAPQGGAR